MRGGGWLRRARGSNAEHTATCWILKRCRAVPLGPDLCVPRLFWDVASVEVRILIELACPLRWKLLRTLDDPPCDGGVGERIGGTHNPSTNLTHTFAAHVALHPSLVAFLFVDVVALL